MYFGRVLVHFESFESIFAYFESTILHFEGKLVYLEGINCEL